MKYRFTGNSKQDKLPTVLRVSYYVDFEDFEYDNDDSWQAKARRLQARRWRKIRNSE